MAQASPLANIAESAKRQEIGRYLVRDLWTPKPRASIAAARSSDLESASSKRGRAIDLNLGFSSPLNIRARLIRE